MSIDYHSVEIVNAAGEKISPTSGTYRVTDTLVTFEPHPREDQDGVVHEDSIGARVVYTVTEA